MKMLSLLKKVAVMVILLFLFLGTDGQTREKVNGKFTDKYECVKIVTNNQWIENMEVQVFISKKSVTIYIPSKAWCLQLNIKELKKREQEDGDVTEYYSVKEFDSSEFTLIEYTKAGDLREVIFSMPFERIICFHLLQDYLG